MSAVSRPVLDSDAPAHAPTDAPTDAAARTSADTGPTFARRRLRLGITGVGLTVLLAAAWLAALYGAVPLPSAVAAAADASPVTPLRAALLVFGVFAAHALLLLPVEGAGGRTMARDRVPIGSWAFNWLRGVFVLLLVASVSASLSAGLTGMGAPLPVVGAALALALLAAQHPLARAIATIRLRRADAGQLATARQAALAAAAQRAGLPLGDLRVADAGDRAFVGGWVGLVAPRLWIPAHWLAEPDAQAPDGLLVVQLVRRAAQRRSGARRLGLIGATGWVATGLAVAGAALPDAPTDARFWAAIPAAMALWSFLGVLVLPSLSRYAVIAADREAAALLGRDPVADATARLDRWQDDEPARTPLVETVFHPVPSVSRRIAALDEAAGTSGAGAGAHHLTRLMLFAGLAGLSPLGRAVHCNVGRPALWAVYPGD